MKHSNYQVIFHERGREFVWVKQGGCVYAQSGTTSPIAHRQPSLEHARQATITYLNKLDNIERERERRRTA